MQFRHFLAEQLGCFVAELDAMDLVEYMWWQQHFKNKHEREKEAMEQSRRSRGRRR